MLLLKKCGCGSCRMQAAFFAMNASFSRFGESCRKAAEATAEAFRGIETRRLTWRAISCSVRIDYGEHYSVFNVPFGEPDQRIIKFLVCGDEQCLDAALERVVAELRLSFAEEKLKFERS